MPTTRTAPNLRRRQLRRAEEMTVGREVMLIKRRRQEVPASFLLDFDADEEGNI